jgi:hypothetical protein
LPGFAVILFWRYHAEPVPLANACLEGTTAAQASHVEAIQYAVDQWNELNGGNPRQPDQHLPPP